MGSGFDQTSNFETMLRILVRDFSSKMVDQSEGPYMEEFNFSLALVKSAGDVIKSAINKTKVVSEKSSATDLGR